MRILYLGEEPRYMLGSAASLMARGHDVYYLRLIRNVLKVCVEEIPVEVRTRYPIRVKQIIMPYSWSIADKIRPVDVPSQIFNLLKEISPDMIISRSDAWPIAQTISKKLHIKLILYTMTIRGLKLFSFIRYAHKYTEAFIAPLSVLYNIWQSYLSDFVITWSTRMEKYLRKAGVSRIAVVRPPYTRYNFATIEEKIDVPQPYVLAITTLSRGEGTAKIDLAILKLILLISSKVPEITFAVIGTLSEDLKIFGYSLRASIPKNVKFIGKIYNDNVLASLYKRASCVLCPQVLPGFSNRLLEAFFYAKPIITTEIIARFYDGLINGKHAIVEGDFSKYSRWIYEVVNNNILRKRLEAGAKSYYREFFSPGRHALLLEHVIASLKAKH